VHHASANPNNQDIAVDPRSDPAFYYATDRTNPNFFISGTLKQGVLEFTVLTKLPGQIGVVSGTDFFAAMLAHFTPGRVQGIKGVWIAGIGLDTNIDEFNTLTRNGLSDPDAARRVWTGRRASDYGFINVTIDFKDPPGNHPGQYNEVVALFSR
jgi:hypothetical protein